MKFVFRAMILLSLVSCGSKAKKTTQTQQTTAAPPALSVEAFVASGRTINQTIEVPGTILPFESTEIHPEVSGRVVALNVREGSFVSRGSLIAKIYDGDLQAQLRKLQVQLNIAEQSERRSAQLLKIQGISQQDYDLSLLNVNNIKADIDITRAAISKTTVLAPFSGKLGLKNISPGAFVTPATVITTIGQVSQLKIQFTVPEKYGSEIKKGQEINFTVDGSLANYVAVVAATEVAIQEESRSLLVRAVVKGSPPALVPGAFAKVEIVLGKNENAIMIPNSAVVPQGRNKLIYLYRNGKAEQSSITTGIRDSANIEVLTGIREGDTVLSTGLLFLRPGADVKLTKIDK